MSYGETARPPFRDLTHHASLPKKHLPSASNDKRLIVVGDVHGMRSALEALLEKVGFDAKRDHLVLAGDLINKGPDSPGVVDLAMKLGASAVRGNHEDRVLLARSRMRKHHVTDSDSVGGDGEDMADDDLELNTASRGDHRDRSTARSLSHKQVAWLNSLPVILDVGNIPTLGHTVVVHAGLVPGLALKKQDPWAVMNMRTIIYPREELKRATAPHLLEKPNAAGEIEGDSAAAGAGKKRKPKDRDAGVPSDSHDGHAWTDVWNALQKTLSADERTTVIYGHDSKKGLVTAKYTMGLDTGCVMGKKLSAVVIGNTRKGMKHDIVHVKCDAPKDGQW